MEHLVSYSESSDEDSIDINDPITALVRELSPQPAHEPECKTLDINHVKDHSICYTFEPNKVANSANNKCQDASTRECSAADSVHGTNIVKSPENCKSQVVAGDAGKSYDDDQLRTGESKILSKGTGNLNDKGKDTVSSVGRSTPAVGKEVYSDFKNRKRKRQDSDTKVFDLPSTITSMFLDKQHSHVDDPALHQNRVRSFAHEEGNWATHVYIPVRQDEQLIMFVHDLLETLLLGTFEILPEFHASLSRTVPIRYHWIQPLVDSLMEEMKKLPSSMCEVVDVKIFTNDEKTRSFVCLEMSEDDTELLNYVKAVDSCFKDFKLPPYYQNPSFHISVGWCLGDVTGRIPSANLTRAKAMLTKFMESHPDLSIVYANQVCCRSGNKSFMIPLADYVR